MYASMESLFDLFLFSVSTGFQMIYISETKIKEKAICYYVQEYVLKPNKIT